MGSIARRGEGAVEELGGKLKKHAGRLVGDQTMENKGAAKEQKGKGKQIVAKAEERVKGTFEKLKGSLRKALNN